MGSNIELNAKGMKDLEKEITKKLRKETQAFMDKFTRLHQGQPVEEIRPALQSEWKRKMDGKITEPKLTAWAKVISDGGRIEVR